MYIKKNNTWVKRESKLNETDFENNLNKIKQYSKSFNSSVYSTTTSLDDVYDELKFQTAFWIELTSFAPDTITLFGHTFENKDVHYNLLKYTDTNSILDSNELRDYIKMGYIKAANKKLYDNTDNKKWFCAYTPIYNTVVLNKQFDYLVLRYEMKDQNSQDIDTKTAIVDTLYNGQYKRNGVLVSSPFLDGRDVGVGSNTSTIFESINNEVFLQYAGDNTSSIGGESVLISFSNIAKNINYLDQILVRLRAFFQGNLGNGEIDIIISTYLGGTMVINNSTFDFDNIGGIKVESIIYTKKITIGGIHGNSIGDEVGTLVYDKINKSVLLTDLTNTYISSNNLKFIDILNISSFKWSMGDSSYDVNDPTYTDMLIPYDFNISNFSEYTSDIFYQPTVFTSSKVWEKLLKNYNVLDYATTANIDLNIIYDKIKLIVDGYDIVEQNLILVKDQIIKSENGVYILINKKLIRSKIFDISSDLINFKCFIKYGTMNSNKNYHIDRLENGGYESFEGSEIGCEGTNFDINLVESDNLVLRNKSSYKLLSDHTINNSTFFTGYEPNTIFDFSNRYYTSPTTFFKVSDDLKSYDYYVDGILIKSTKANIISYKIFTQHKLLIQNGINVVLVEYDNSTNIFSTIYTFENDIKVNDIIIDSNTEIYYLSNNLIKKIDTTNNNILETILLPDNSNATEFTKIFKQYTQTFINYEYYFYISDNKVLIKAVITNTHLNTKKEYDLNIGEYKGFVKNLRSSIDNDIIYVSFIDSSNSPIEYKISDLELKANVEFTYSPEYKLTDFSKTVAGDFKIVDNNLFLKEIQLSNTTSGVYEYPKINNTSRFDGYNDYIDLKNVVLTKDCTIEFCINPTVIEYEQPVFYFGKKIQHSTNITGISNIIFPSEYLTFYLSRNINNGYPTFFIKKDNKTIEIISDTKLLPNIKTYISFVWTYTNSKSNGYLYFDSILVGSFTDQQSSNNLPLDIIDLSIEQAFIGKSEFETQPLYKGYISEFKIWNKSLNRSQILDRKGDNISTNDVLYSNLVSYYKLIDITNTVKNEIDITKNGFFVGGLGESIQLKEIQKVSEIQMSDKYLFIKDTNNKDSKEYNVNDLSIYDNNTDNVIILDNRLYVNELQHELLLDISNINNRINKSGDIIEITIESAIDGSNGSNSINLKAATSGGVLTDIFSPTVITYTNSNVKKTVYTKTLTSDYILMYINLIADTNSFYDKISYKITRIENLDSIYKIDLDTEIVSKISTPIISYPIISTYLSDQKEYYIMQNSSNNYKEIFKYDTGGFVSYYNSSISDDYIDFTVDSSSTNLIKKLFLLRNNYVLVRYDSTRIPQLSNYVNIADTNADLVNKGFLYMNNKTLYYKDTNDNIFIYDTNFSRSYSYITEYPFQDPNIISVSLNGLYELKNNDVYLNNKIIDVDNYYWNFNKSEILNINRLDKYIYVLVRNIKNEIKLYSYDTYTTNINIVNDRVGSVLFKDNTNIDFSISLYSRILTDIGNISIIEHLSHYDCILPIVDFIIDNRKFKSSITSLHIPQNNTIYDRFDIIVVDIYFNNNYNNVRLITGVASSNNVLPFSEIDKTKVVVGVLKVRSNNAGVDILYSTFYEQQKNIDSNIYFTEQDIMTLTPTRFMFLVDNKIFISSFEKDFKINYNYTQLIVDTKYDKIYTNIGSDSLEYTILTNDKTIIRIDNNYNYDYKGFYSNNSFIKHRSGWLIGDFGVMFKANYTNDVFVPEYKNIIYRDDLYSICNITETIKDDKGYDYKKTSNYIYSVGKQGFIIKSIDNGDTWNVIKSGVISDFRSVSFFNKDYGLIVGDNNTILATFSGGDSFVNVNVDGITRNWTSVLYYETDKAIVLGSSGTIILLQRLNLDWSVSKILNIETDILRTEDLEDYIKINIVKNSDVDYYRQSLRAITQISDNEFIITGDNNFIAKLGLLYKNNYIIPEINVFNPSIFGDWLDVQVYTDYYTNIKTAYVLSNTDIITIDYDHINYLDSVNIEDVKTNLYYSAKSDVSLKDISISDSNIIITGSNITIEAHSLNDAYIESYDMSGIFKPRMLFLDYYLGRKINILDKSGSYLYSSGVLNKEDLDCYLFKPTEYLEFSDITPSGMNNYLAYQDYYYLNHKKLDIPNSRGQIATPYNKYNKRITAVSIEDYDKLYKWDGSNDYAIFSNKPITDLSTYISGTVELSDSTKINISWNNVDTNYTLTTYTNFVYYGHVEDDGIFKYTLKITSTLNLINGDLIKLSNPHPLTYSILDKQLFKVNKEFISSNQRYIEIESFEYIEDIISSTLTTHTIHKALLGISNSINAGDILNIVAVEKYTNQFMNINDSLILKMNIYHIEYTETVIVSNTDVEDVYQIVLNLKDLNVKNPIIYKFPKNTTIDELLLLLKNENSDLVKISEQQATNRCLELKSKKIDILESNIVEYSSNKNQTCILEIEDKIYVLSSNKTLTVLDKVNNIVLKTIILTGITESLYMSYNSHIKSICITGGYNFGLYNILDDSFIISSNLPKTMKSFYSSKYNLTYITTTNTIYTYSGITQISSVVLPTAIFPLLSPTIKDSVYCKDDNKLYVLCSDGWVKIYDKLTFLGQYRTIDDDNLNVYKIIYDSNSRKIISDCDGGLLFLHSIDGVISDVQILDEIMSNNSINNVPLKIINNRLITELRLNIGVFIVSIDINLNDITDIKSSVDKYFIENEFIDIEYNIKESKYYTTRIDGIIELYDSTFTYLDTKYLFPYGYSKSLNYLSDKMYCLKVGSRNMSYLRSGDFEPSNIIINLNKKIVETTLVVKNIVKNEITFYGKLDDELIYELNQSNVYTSIRNLNYFNCDILSLKTTLDKHLLGESYEMIIDKKDIITIKGKITDNTKYYNTETNVIFYRFSKPAKNIQIVYNSSVIYGPNYSILNLLNNLNPIFDEFYTFEYMLDFIVFTYNQANSLNQEFTIQKNKIYIGNALNIGKLKAGLFYDINSNLSNKNVKRVYIKSIVSEDNKIVITTDKLLESNLDLSGTFTIRGRNKLKEISDDLEFTDNIMKPISNNINIDILDTSSYYLNQTTSYEYANVLMHDTNIKSEISCVVSIDNEDDLTLKILDWKNDPNFYFRPLELFEIGVDKIFKKAITIDSSNYFVSGNRLSLVNVDKNIYNYKITDNLTLKEIEDKYYWILNADIRNAIIGEDSNGFVWYTGDWIAGTFENGTWYSGKAYDIEWISGIAYSYNVINNFNEYLIDKNNTSFTNTIWYKSVFYSGSFNGTWNSGIFYKGDFNGDFNGGTFMNGNFTGSFNGGVWKDGTFISGIFSQNNTYSIWYNGLWLTGDFENGVWKNGIFDQTSETIKSRFGTKASLLNNAVWEYGLFKNGEFHSGNNSSNKFSIWKNGTWEKGIFYAGQFEFGTWQKGVFENGIFRSNINIKEWRVRNYGAISDKREIEIVFDRPHYYKELIYNNSVIENSFIILGKPDIIKGEIHHNTQLLGHNTNAIKHIVKEIVNDTTIVIVINNSNYPYRIDDENNGYIDFQPDITNFNTALVLNPTVSLSQDFNIREKIKMCHNKIVLQQISNLNPNYYEYSNINTIGQNFSNNISNVTDIVYHPISKRTFVANNTNRIYVYDSDLNFINYVNMVSTFKYLDYDKKNDIIVCTPEKSSTVMVSGRYRVDIKFLNPINYSISSININKTYIFAFLKPVIGSSNDNFIYFTLKRYEADNITIRKVFNSLVKIQFIINNIIVIYGSSPGNLIINDTGSKKIWFNDINQIAFGSDIYKTLSYINDDNSSSTNSIDVYYSDINSILDVKYVYETNELFIIENNKLFTYKYSDRYIKMHNLLMDNNLTICFTFPDPVNSVINDIKWSAYYNSYFVACTDNLYVLDKSKTNIVYTYNITNVKEIFVNLDVIYFTTNTNLYIIKHVCENNCIDYTINEIVVEDSNLFDTSTFQYIGTPRIAIEWIEGKFNSGIWEYGYFRNGDFKGLWLDGVFENGKFST